MTIEEAIAWFEYEKEHCEAFSISRPNKRIEAYKMAIKALQENKEWKEYKDECDSYHTK